MTASIIRPFLFEGEVTVRAFDNEGELSFIIADVCRALGISNYRDAAAGLDDDEKGVATTDTLAGRQEMLTVNESGLYSLIFKSKKPDAIKFRRWVTREVLPALRKHGAYFTVTAPDAVKLVKKPWVEWSLEERRLAISEVNTARRVLNSPSALWLWGCLGLPMPPTHLLPAWYQGELGIWPSLSSN